jgi:hypothetical protein
MGGRRTICAQLLSCSACAFSVLLAAVASLAFLGAVSCATHALLVVGPGGDPQSAGPVARSSPPSASLQAAGSAAALASLALLGVFLGGVGVALRICSLGLGLVLLAGHLWLRAASPLAMAEAADRLLRGVLLPARNALALPAEWDCVFLGPADALYMLAALRHAAAVVGAMVGSLGQLAAGVRHGGGAGALAAEIAAMAPPQQNPPPWWRLLGG